MDELGFLCFSFYSPRERHTRIDHMTPSVVVFPDTFLCRPRIRDEIIYMNRTLDIDLSEIVNQLPEKISEKGIEKTKFEHMNILFVVTPIVANGSVAIAKYDLFFDSYDHFGISLLPLQMIPSPHGYLLGFRATRTDDDVIF